MKPVFVLLGCNILNDGILRKLEGFGADVVVVDRNPHPAIFGYRNYQLDTRFPDPIIARLKDEGLWDRVRFAFTCQDVAVSSMSAIAKAAGVLTMGEDGLAHASSKGAMTKRWAEKGILNRESRAYGAWEDSILDWSRQIKLIVKPDNAASSRGITILEKGVPEADVRAAFDKAIEEAGDKHVVVEEFVEGTEFTVEMLGDSHGHVGVYGISKKQHTKNIDRNKVAVKLHYNSVSDELQQKIAAYAIRCYRALGFSCSFGHLEILLKADGTLSPVEIGARSSGYIASDLVDIVSGRDFLGDLYKVQQGAETPDGLVPQTDRSSMYFFYDIPGGSVIRRDCRITDFLDPAITSRRSWKSEGFTVGATIANIDNDNARLGLEVLEGPKSLMTEAYVAECEKKMLEYMLG